MYSKWSGPLKLNRRCHRSFHRGSLLEVVRWIDQQVAAVRIRRHAGDTGEPVETGPDHIHGDNRFFDDQIIEQVNQFFTLDFSCFRHNGLPLIKKTSCLQRFPNPFFYFRRWLLNL
jgi:hypothetical protein